MLNFLKIEKNRKKNNMFIFGYIKIKFNFNRK